MPYIPTTWVDGPGGGTPITASQLNRMETGIARVNVFDGVSSSPANGEVLQGVGGAWVAGGLDDLLDTTPITAADFGLCVPKTVRVYASSSGQSITAAAYPVYLDLNTTEVNDDATLFTVDLTNNKITVTEDGLYLAGWDVTYVNGSDRRDAYLSKNAGNAYASASATVIGHAYRSGVPIRLVAGDYLQVICYVEGATVALVTTSSYQCGLSLTRVGL